MIDWHSHILPAMDDGSSGIDESREMLELLKEQGVDTVIATPHFYANEESVDEFLERRKKTYEELLPIADELDVRIVCGAEVRYYPGISRMTELKRLAIENTKLLLLEMPVSKWTEHTVKELVELANTCGLRIIMAHIERYIALQDKGVFQKLIDNGMLMQVNASFFERTMSKHKALRLLDAGCIHLIGTDCHNLTTRAPRIETAYDYIQKKRGEDFVSQMIEYGHYVLGRV